MVRFHNGLLVLLLYSLREDCAFSDWLRSRLTLSVGFQCLGFLWDIDQVTCGVIDSDVAIRWLSIGKLARKTLVWVDNA